MYLILKRLFLSSNPSSEKIVRGEIVQTERNSTPRPERATAHSPGQAKRHPGLRIAIVLTPCKGKSLS